jgi:copper chaperone NosL
MSMAFMVLMLGLMACHQGAATPEEPVWDKQPCGHCSMLLSDRRTAAQLLLPDGSRKFFDDIGCMVEWLSEEGAKPRAMWVRNPDGTGWVSTEGAHFSSGARTPMDYGYVASSDGLSFDELRQRVSEASRARQGGTR